VKTLTSCLGALVSYFVNWPLETDYLKPRLQFGKAWTETSFAIPLERCLHPVTGDPVTYAGRYDMLAERDGVLFLVDDKTASQLGARWRDQWELRSQFTGYVWSCRTYDIPVAGVITRGTSILKEKFGHEEAITYRSPWLVDRWLDTVHSIFERMVKAWHEGKWVYDLDSACTMYGKCPYMQLCGVEDPEPWIQSEYVVERWNPLAQREG
jgi:hypothetical protein